MSKNIAAKASFYVSTILTVFAAALALSFYVYMVVRIVGRWVGAK